MRPNCTIKIWQYKKSKLKKISSYKYKNTCPKDDQKMSTSSSTHKLQIQTKNKKPNLKITNTLNLTMPQNKLWKQFKIIITVDFIFFIIIIIIIITY